MPATHPGPLSAGVQRWPADRVRRARTGGFLVASANRGLRYLPFDRDPAAGVGVGSAAAAVPVRGGHRRRDRPAWSRATRMAAWRVYDLGDRWPLGGAAADDRAARRARRPPTRPTPSGATARSFAWYEQATDRIRLAASRRYGPAGCARRMAPFDRGDRPVRRRDAPGHGGRPPGGRRRWAGPSWSGRCRTARSCHEERLGPWGYPDRPRRGRRAAAPGRCARWTLAPRPRTDADGPVAGARRTRSVAPSRPWSCRRTAGRVTAGANLGRGPFGRAALLTWDADGRPGAPPAS